MPAAGPTSQAENVETVSSRGRGGPAVKGFMF
jgi:hypothetical protein